MLYDHIVHHESYKSITVLPLHRYDAILLGPDEADALGAVPQEVVQAPLVIAEDGIKIRFLLKTFISELVFLLRLWYSAQVIVSDEGELHGAGRHQKTEPDEAKRPAPGKRRSLWDRQRPLGLWDCGGCAGGLVKPLAWNCLPI